ncbi:SET domain-containing protein SmydA-8 isoform X3 [Dendroctonus ponderosae]|nr:SET domain-containing protein SmydA-8 isoform X3 [Dendroctonus ponderosae]
MTAKTYKITQSDSLGRYMVAKRQLKQGELILKEEAVLVGPHLNGPARCFKCLKTINLLMCSFCNQCNTALMCTNDCQGKHHSDDECLTLRTQKIKGQILAENPSVIFPLCCLLLGIYNPEVYEEIISMESHLEERRNTPIWRRHKISVEDILKDTNLLTPQDLQEEVVQKICGILDVNSIEVKCVRPANLSNLPIVDPEKQCLRGLYPKVAMIAHNCLPNAYLAADDNFSISVYAKVDIKEEAPIFINYTNVLQGNQERQLSLLEGKYFTCTCSRCRDPSELGTEISSLICHKCRKGFLRYTELEENFQLWKCSECKQCFKDFLIKLAIEEAKRRIDDLDPTDVQQMENLYKKLLLTFHPNHYLLLGLKQALVSLYSKLPPTKSNLNRKIDLCGRLMSVFGKLEPGISRIKALTMYELQSAIVDISNKQYRDKEIGDEELISELQTAEKILKDSVKYLLYEPPKSPEGRMAQMGLNELKMLRNSIQSIQKDLVVSKEQQGDKKAEIARRLKEKLEKNREKTQKSCEGVITPDGGDGENGKLAKPGGKKRNKKKTVT